VKKSSRNDPESIFESEHIEDAPTVEAVFEADAQLVAGTAWLFADAELEQALDYLFVDEAGQVSLANLVAMGMAARNLVLLGDQMQPGQPIQGVHPGRSGDSSLDYLLDGLATIPPGRGIFLPTSFRMHEDVCRFISEAVYDGRLCPEPANQTQTLLLGKGAHPALRPTGIVFVPLEHDGNGQRSRCCSSRRQAVHPAGQPAEVVPSRRRAQSAPSTSSRGRRPRPCSFRWRPRAASTCRATSSSSTTRTG
jgi:uncharacterized protein